MKRNYVVRLWAPVSVRVAAENKRDAIRRALREMPTRDPMMLGVEDDDAPQWLEAIPWKHDKEDFEGGVYLSQVQGEGEK